MPTQRVPLILFSGSNQLTSSYFRALQGLTLTGPSTADAPVFLRRARGLHETCLNELRPAPGNALLFPVPGVHTISRFNDQRFYAAGSVLFRDGSPILTGLNGQRLTLTRIPPGNTQRDQLFVAGGGLGRKISPAGIVTNWGIDPPPDGMAVALVSQLTKTVELFEDHTTWTLTPAAATKANEATIKQEGANSLKLTIPSDTLAILTKTVTLNLSQFSTPGDSSNEDYIELWVRVDGTGQGLDSITLRFDVGAGDFSSDYYQFKIVPSTITQNTLTLQGIGADPAVNAGETSFVGSAINDDGQIVTPRPADSNPTSNETSLVATSATWTRLRMAKSSFLRSGSTASNWGVVAAIQLMVKTTSAANIICYFDFCRLRGGAGLLGDYQSLVTFENSGTGARSNSNPTPVVTLQNDRQRLLYTNIPVSPDSQVSRRNLWRTLGNGALFFHEHDILDSTTTTYTSDVADFVGLWTNVNSNILFLPELLTDNIRPEESHIDFIYDQATVFWLSGEEGKRGRVYFSPAGRPEAQRGFIQVCQDDIPLLRLIVWQRARYAVGEAGWYRIDGTEPYTAFKFEGIPGMIQAQARTLIPTPYGILAQCQDGLRMFNGSQSQLFQFDRVGPLFRGEALEQLLDMQAICACFARDQYFISDGVQTLSFNLSTGFIRDLGQGFTSLYYEEDTKLLLGGSSQGLVIVEDLTAPPSIPCAWQTTALYSPPGQVSTVQRLYIDAATGGQPIDVTLLIDGQERKLPPFVLAQRGFIEYPLGMAYQSFAVRLDFAPTASTRVYQFYADIYSAPSDPGRQQR